MQWNHLKGYIALNGSELVKTHDLVFLNKICSQYTLDFKEIMDDCIELVDYGVEARYPSKNKLIEADAKRAIASAENIRRFVLERT